MLHATVSFGTHISAYAQRYGDVIEVVGYFSDFPGMPNFGATALYKLAGPDPVLVWSHGKRSPLEFFLREEQFVPVRTVHQMRMRLSDPVERPTLPAGVTIRSYVPGQDEDAFLRVNAAAFAGHAEQGSWTRADLDARMTEPWFEPAGLLLAERDGTVLGFHFTKRHEDGLGEVYVIGVDPAAQGLGLGRLLLLHGLRHLQDRGCYSVLLYVDDDNATARALYRKLMFTDFDRDTQWRRG